jgi:hypothetical protein
MLSSQPVVLKKKQLFLCHVNDPKQTRRYELCALKASEKMILSQLLASGIRNIAIPL